MAFVFALIVAFLIAGLIGSKRKIGFGWSLVACIFLSPIIGLIITLCSKKLPPEEAGAEKTDEKPLEEALVESSENTGGITNEPTVMDNASEESKEDTTTIDY